MGRGRTHQSYALLPPIPMASLFLHFLGGFFLGSSFLRGIQGKWLSAFVLMLIAASAFRYVGLI